MGSAADKKEGDPGSVPGFATDMSVTLDSSLHAILISLMPTSKLPLSSKGPGAPLLCPSFPTGIVER